MFVKCIFAILFNIIAANADTSTPNSPIITYVTSFYDIKRGQSLSPRSRDYYLDYFRQLLEVDMNLIVFGDDYLKEFVWKHRKQHNTLFVEYPIQNIRKKWFYNQLESVRKQRLTWPRFFKGSDILFSLQDYNAIMLTKIDFMEDAQRLDPFNSNFLYWIDAGFFHLGSQQQMKPQHLISKLLATIQPIWFNHAYSCCQNRFFGYTNDINSKYLQRTLNPQSEPIIAHIYGGIKEIMRDSRSAFVNLIKIHFRNNDLSSDESFWTILQIRYPYLFPNNFQGTFNLSNNTITIKSGTLKNSEPNRYFSAKITKEEIISMGQNLMINYSYNFTNSNSNARAVLDSKYNSYNQQRIILMRNKLANREITLMKRIIFLIIVIAFWIGLTVYARTIIRKNRGVFEQNKLGTFTKIASDQSENV